VFRKLFPTLFLFAAGCSYLDFGGNDEKDFELRFFWDRVPFRIGEEDPNNPGFDKDGNKLVSPEILATYYFPDVTAGVYAVVQPEPRITPTVGIELFEAKLWKARWFSAQVFAGHQLVGFSFNKRLTSIVEITAGPFVGRDFGEDEWAWGIGGTLLKF
jgi:hypothetical protein